VINSATMANVQPRIDTQNHAERRGRGG